MDKIHPPAATYGNPKDDLAVGKVSSLTDDGQLEHGVVSGEKANGNLSKSLRSRHMQMIAIGAFERPPPASSAGS